MDTLRGMFESGEPGATDTVGVDPVDADSDSDSALDLAADDEAVHGAQANGEIPPHAIGQDERRMQVRAYNHWASLLGERTYPGIEDLVPEELDDFGPNSVLLDFSAGVENPVVQFLGDCLAEECGAEGAIRTLADVPPRSLLSRITDHYMQILANEAPIGFEAEFVNQRGSAILYRGILLPFSSDDETIDFIYGVINWKEMADQLTSDELLLEIDQALETDGQVSYGEDAADADCSEDGEEDEARVQPADPLTEWADSPGRESEIEEVGERAEEQADDDVLDLSGRTMVTFDDMGELSGDLRPELPPELPIPDFGQYALDDPEDEDEEGSAGESEASYNFASLADYLETPAKKAVDLDADKFDPADYRLDEAEGDEVGAEDEDPGYASLDGGAFEAETPADEVPDRAEMAIDPTMDEQAIPEDDDLEHETNEAAPAPAQASENADASTDPATDEAGEPDRFDHEAADFDDEPEAEPDLAPDPDAGLHDCLASARELARSARASEDRSRNALYAAVGRAYDVSLAAQDSPEEFTELVETSGLTMQDRAPMTPVVKLVFGGDYDKTRLTEYAAVLSHAHRLGLERGALAGFLGEVEGGLKAVVQAERRLRREEAGKPVETEKAVREALAEKLRELEAMMFDALDPDGPEFGLVMIRRDETGTVHCIGEIEEDVPLIERAARKLVG